MKKIEDYYHSGGNVGIYCKSQEEWDRIISLIRDYNDENLEIGESDYDADWPQDTISADGSGCGEKSDYSSNGDEVYDATDFFEPKDDYNIC